MTEERKTARVRRAAWATTALLGALQAFLRRHEVSPDGVSYLDVAEAYARGDWSTAVNAYWSPLYSWILVPVTEWIPAPAYWEATLVHAVHFLFLLAALAAFEFLLSSVERAVPAVGDAERGVPRWLWRAFGYAVFLWSALDLVGLEITTPDLAVEAVVFLMVGLLLRARAGAPAGRTAALLGLAVGVGYLTKAVLAPIGLLVLALLALEVGGGWRRRLRAVATSGAVAALVAGPFVVALSLDEGRLTAGETGKLNYAWYANGVRRWIHWQGELPGAGTPRHPTRRLMSRPEVFAFSEPLEVSYPPWYDPPHWHEGLELSIRPARQAAVLVDNLEYYLALAPWLLILPLSLLGALRSEWLRSVWREARPLLIVGAAGLGAYALLHVADRLIAPFVVLPALSPVIGIREVRGDAGVWLRGLCLATAAMAGLFALDATVEAALERRGHVDWRVAQAVRSSGAGPGGAVAVVDIGFEAYWAHLADVRIVAEVPRNARMDFWAAEPARRAEVRRALRGAGAGLVVASEPPDWASAEGWERIPGTPYVMRRLAPGDGP